MILYGVTWILLTPLEVLAKDDRFMDGNCLIKVEWKLEDLYGSFKKTFIPWSYRTHSTENQTQGQIVRVARRKCVQPLLSYIWLKAQIRNKRDYET
jgi:hypothetical protein